MKFYFECDEFLKYLYSNEIEKVENDTAIDKWDATISKTTWQKWRALNIEHLDEKRINALNEKGSAKIATFQDIERLCEIIKMDVSTPNAKRVFNMLISADPDLKYVASDEKTDAKKHPLRCTWSTFSMWIKVFIICLDVPWICRYFVIMENKLKESSPDSRQKVFWLG